MIQVTVETRRSCTVNIDTDDLDFALREAERMVLADANSSLTDSNINWNPCEIDVMYHEMQPAVVDASDYFYQMSRDRQTQGSEVA